MNAKQLERLLIANSACDEGLEWARGRTLRDAWKNCQVGSFMWWFIEEVEGDNGEFMVDDDFEELDNEILSALEKWKHKYGESDNQKKEKALARIIRSLTELVDWKD